MRPETQVTAKLKRTQKALQTARKLAEQYPQWPNRPPTERWREVKKIEAEIELLEWVLNIRRK